MVHHPIYPNIKKIPTTRRLQTADAVRGETNPSLGSNCLLLLLQQLLQLLLLRLAPHQGLLLMQLLQHPLLPQAACSCCCCCGYCRCRTTRSRSSSKI